MRNSSGITIVFSTSSSTSSATSAAASAAADDFKYCSSWLLKVLSFHLLHSLIIQPSFYLECQLYAIS